MHRYDSLILHSESIDILKQDLDQEKKLKEENEVKIQQLSSQCSIFRDTIEEMVKEQEEKETQQQSKQVEKEEKQDEIAFLRQQLELKEDQIKTLQEDARKIDASAWKERVEKALESNEKAFAHATRIRIEQVCRYCTS